MKFLVRLPAKLLLCAVVSAACGQVAPSQEWFRDAKFGIFIRWGLYAIPAGEWNGQAIPGPANRIMRDAGIPVGDYARLAGQFNPSGFDAAAWVNLAAASGARYIVVTAQDRDGFAMYRSGVNQFNVSDATPFHRDPLKELAAACAKQGIRFGIALSPLENWHEPELDAKQLFTTKAQPQIRELLSGYGPLALMWLETPPADARPFLSGVADLIHALQPAALLNGEPGVRYSSSYTALDRVPEARAAGPWQASASMNGSSGYNQYANNWKSPDQIVFDLVDSVSKGGNYLIGIGPTAEGIIPRPEQTNLENVGTWLKSNAEAIYGAGPTVFGDELRDTRWRCTSKRGKLFITLFQWPSGPLMLNGVKARVTKASFLSDPAHKSLPITQSGARLSIALPKDPPVEGEFPSRIDPNLYLLSLRAHLRRVIVLETVP